MTKVIINADDLGLSPRVNDAVFALMRAGRLTSATIMAAGPAVADAAARSREHPRCSFGVHLTLTELRPLTGDGGLAPLLSERGEFAGNVRSVAVTRGLARAIENEWIAQIEKVKSLGVAVSHLDGHHHIHTHPPFFRVLKRVQQATGVRRARCTMNLYHPDDPMQGGTKRRLLKAAWNRSLRLLPPRTTTTDIFTAFWVYHDLLPGAPRAETVELMVHPGADDPIFQREERLMSTPWEERASAPISLISFNDL